MTGIPLLQACNRSFCCDSHNGENYISSSEFDRDWISDVNECNEPHFYLGKYYLKQEEVYMSKNIICFRYIKETISQGNSSFFLDFNSQYLRTFKTKVCYYLCFPKRDILFVLVIKPVFKPDSPSPSVFLLHRECTTASRWGGEQLHCVFH